MTHEDFVAVIDDDDDLREMLCLMLHGLKIPVTGYSHGREFIEDAQRPHCACVVVDLRMPGMSGIELQRHIRKDTPELPVIFMTAHADVRVVVDAMRDGAVEFLQKPIQGQELLDCVQQCLQQLPQRKQKKREREVFMARLANLTPRERQVFEQIAAGMSSKQIADNLSVTLNTAEQYRSTVLKKMHASSTAKLLSALEPWDYKATLK
ncbi:response regulator transcription factor [Chromobacterium alticapitis]|uniref:DNA-binding response regulator n=1 Tax=Chromobacterium alticapitis TaxID=2073169 RepID=A0A2S5DGZ1_9NEIS|nr:response regulator [Chromobacterium alticapitis]POZ62262.1 DNA-binding response regulator [Chromobacterium alticapitis]